MPPEETPEVQAPETSGEQMADLDLTALDTGGEEETTAAAPENSPKSPEFDPDAEIVFRGKRTTFRNLGTEHAKKYIGLGMADDAKRAQMNQLMTRIRELEGQHNADLELARHARSDPRIRRMLETGYVPAPVDAEPPDEIEILKAELRELKEQVPRSNLEIKRDLALRDFDGAHPDLTDEDRALMAEILQDSVLSGDYGKLLELAHAKLELDAMKKTLPQRDERTAARLREEQKRKLQERAQAASPGGAMGRGTPPPEPEEDWSNLSEQEFLDKAAKFIEKRGGI